MTEDPGFLDRFVREGAAVEAGCRFIFIQQVHRDLEELGGGASMEEEDLVLLVQLHQLPGSGDGLV
jgi:hypothetical protein